MTIDVMMPFYGRTDQFKLAVESVQEQTSSDWRLTVIDDQNPDPEAARWFSRIDDPRMRYVVNQRNLGVSANFQRAVDLAEAELVVIMGCDDVMRPRFIARAHELSARYPEAAVIQPGVEVIDDEGILRLPLSDRVKRHLQPRGERPFVLKGEPFAASIARADWAYFPSLVWQSSALRETGFRQDLEVALDLQVLLEFAARGMAFVVDDEPVFAYRRHDASVSSRRAVEGSRFVEERTVLSAAARRFTGLGWHKAARIAHRATVSRLNALSVLPRALASDQETRALIIRHVLGLRHT